MVYFQVTGGFPLLTVAMIGWLAGTTIYMDKPHLFTIMVPLPLVTSPISIYLSTGIKLEASRTLLGPGWVHRAAATADPAAEHRGTIGRKDIEVGLMGLKDVVVAVVVGRWLSVLLVGDDGWFLRWFLIVCRWLLVLVGDSSLVLVHVD